MELHYSDDGLEFATREQLLVFKKLKEQINNCYKKNLSFKKHIQALEFCLTTHTTIYIDDVLYSFTTMCDLLEINADIMRIRLMYELYLQKTVIPFDYLVSNIRIPSDLISEILLSCRDLNLMRAIHYIYTHPSITFSELFSKFNAIEAQIEQLILDGYLVNNDEHVYFIGKNPALIKCFRWSTLL